MSVQKLFRDEALQHHKDKLLGEVLLIRPLALSVLTILAVTVAIALALFLYAGEYTRKARLAGFLVAKQGVAKVYAREAGIVIEKRVAERGQVKQGEVLAVLSLERGSTRTGETAAAVSSEMGRRRENLAEERNKQVELAGLETEQIRKRIVHLEDELKQARNEAKAQEQRVTTLREITDRFRELSRENFVSPVQYQQRLNEQQEQEVKLENVRRSISSLERELSQARSDLPTSELRAKNRIAALDRAISELDQQRVETEARRDYVLTAPIDGTVSNLQFEVGQNVAASAALLSIVPHDAELEVQLLAPSSAMGFINEGQTVALRYQAFPYQRFGHQNGRVIEVAQTISNPNEHSGPIVPREPVYRVTVKPDKQTVLAYGKELPLQAGMLLEGDVSLDRRRIYEWVLEPLYSLTGRL